MGHGTFEYLTINDVYFDKKNEQVINSTDSDGKKINTDQIILHEPEKKPPRDFTYGEMFSGDNA